MNFLKITLNFLAVVLLIGLIGTPFYFAKNFAQVAGVKSTSPYLLVSQVEKFPNLGFSQSSGVYRISFTKLGSSQAFLGVLIINNPTDETKTYTLQKISGDARPFFGEDPENQLTTVSVPSLASVPISLYSSSESTAPSQTAGFTILTK